MGAVERILEYFSLEKEEENDLLKNERFRDEKCFQEEIYFNSVGIGHLHDPRVVIQVPNLRVPIRQKIGICGRSGSGKSSLLMALVRTTKILSGSVTFGLKNIESIPLQDLRRNVMALPQVSISSAPLTDCFFLTFFLTLIVVNIIWCNFAK